ncbi:MAG: LysM peptidoglycan-binding domain-containing protein [Lentisphaerae bacterium]|nr:LysM peptidoglycan-binding domain-containing protein [Lentisphaerota bacterium]
MKPCLSARCAQFTLMLLGAAGLALFSSCKTQAPASNAGLLGSRDLVPPPYARPLPPVESPRALPSSEPVFPSDSGRGTPARPAATGDMAVGFVPAESPAFIPSDSVADAEQVLLKPEAKRQPSSVSASSTVAVVLPPSPPAGGALEPPARRYQVQKGDTLSGIALAYDVRWQDIAALNPAVDPKRMRVGQDLVLPSYAAEKPGNITRLSGSGSAQKAGASKAKPTTVASLPSEGLYTVVSGDSLWTISQRFKVSIDDIRNWNSLKTDKLMVGQKLKLKGSAGTAKKGAAEAVKSNATTVPTVSTLGPEPASESRADSQSGQEVQQEQAAEQAAIVIPEEVTPEKPIHEKVFTHLAGADDTLESLARDYETKVEDILRLNPQIKSNADLKPGTEVKITLDPNH